MDGSDAPLPPRPNQDSRSTLKAIGIVQIVLGGLWLLAGLTQIGVMGSILALTPNLPRGAAAPMVAGGMVVYGLGGGVLLALGLGTVRIRPWARLFGIVSSSLVLVLGAIGTLAMAGAIAMPHGPGKAELMIMAFGFGFFFLLFVALPVLFIVVYTRPAVRATFEANR